MHRIKCGDFVRFIVNGKSVLLNILLLLAILLSGLAVPQAILAGPGDINTIAGGGIGDTGPATSSSLYLPRGINVTASGVIYIADTLNHRVRKIDTNGIITTVAGNGSPGFSGDGGPATSASLKYPMGVTADHDGNIFIADAHNHRVRKVDVGGSISTIIGGGADNAANYCSLPATDVGNLFSRDLFLDSSNRLYINDGRLWRLEADGTLINLSDPSCGYGILEPGFSSGFFDASGAFVYASGNNIFKTTDMQTSVLLGAFSTVSPGAFPALSGDAFGNIYVASPQSNIVYKLDPTGTSTVFAGTGAGGYSGDGGNAVSANINNPTDVFADTSGNVYIADRMNHRIRKVDLNGTITTAAGTGESDYAGEGLVATSERLSNPRGVFVDSFGNVYVADTCNHRVRKIDTAGIMTTIAGNGAADFSGDGGLATSASLNYPNGIFVGSDGAIYIADSFNDRIRKIDPTGIITTIAGTDDTGYAGDGGPATEAVLNYPTGVIVDASGNIFIADYGNNAIRRIDASGIILTYVNIFSPRSIAIDSSGVLYVATSYDGINKVNPDGTVEIMPSCHDAVGVSVDSAGTVYMACLSDNTIQAATPGIKPGRVAGTWEEAFAGDGGPASEAMLSSPSSVFAVASGALYIADSGNNRVRRVEPGFEIIPILPSVTIIYPSEGEATNRRTFPLWYTVSDGTIVVKVDGVVVNIISGGTIGPLADGQHTIRVEATDSIGTGFAEETITVDTVAPIISVVSPQSGLSNNNHPLLIYSVNEAVAYAYVTLDGSFTWSASGDSLGTLSEGQHSIVISAQDYAGNTGTVVVNFTIDSMPPTVTISAPAAGMTNDSTPFLSYTASNGTVVVKVDGIVVNKVSGNTLDPLDDGPHAVRVEATNANGTGFAQRTFTVDSAAPAPMPDITEDFETGDLGKMPWSTSGNGLWTVKSTVKHAGMYAAEAPQSIGDSQSASLEVSRTTASDSISFWYSVSSETNYDFLKFYMDGVLKGQWSGSVPWTKASYAVSAGTHTFKWVYSKDGSVSAGADTAWIDDIIFPLPPPAPTVTITSPAASVTNSSMPVLAYTVSGGTVVVKVDNVVVNKVSGDTFDPLADGSHVVRVEATDANGTGFSEKAFTVDTIAPTVMISSPIASMVNTKTPVLNYTVSGGTVVVKLDGNVVSKVSGTTLDPLADGTHTVRVESTDVAGNIGFAEVSFIVDTTAPVVSISSPTAGPTNNASLILTYRASDGNVVVKVDGVVVPKVSGDTLDLLADGSHTIRVESTDAAGNPGFAEVTFVVDTVPPAVGINPVTTPTNVNTQIVTGTREGGAIVMVVLNTTATADAVSYSTGTTWSCTINGLVEGTNTVTVTATDAAGNNAPAATSITYDSVTPTIVINAPSAATTNFNKPLLGYTASEGSVVVKVDGNVVQKLSGDTLDQLADGSHTVRVEATDQAGNTGFAEVTFVVDTVPPTVSVNPVTSPTKVNGQTIGGSREGGALITVSVDTSATAAPVVYLMDTTWSSSVNGLAEGINNITITAKDGAQNITTITTSIIYDSIAPAVTIGSPVPGVTNNKTPLLNYAITGGTLSMVSVDGVIVSKTSGQNLDVLADGSHTLRVEATDVAGNTGFAVVVFTVDTVAPAVAINAVSTPTNVSSQTLTGTREENAVVSVAVNTSASVGAISYPSATTWSCTVSNLAVGSNAVTVTATDAAGNPAAAAADITFDGIAPSVTITSPGSAPTNDNTPLLIYSVSDGSVVVKVDGVVASTVSGNSLDTLPDGSHTVRVESTDAAGNAGFAQVIFIVDTAPPAISINPVTTPTKNSSQTISGTRESGASVSVTVDTSATVGTVSYASGTTWSCTISNLVRGSNVITTRAVDAAGNNATATVMIKKT